MANGGVPEHHWRIVWEEVLDRDARHRIKRAMKRREPLQDADEAAVAVERGRRLRRVVRWSVALNMLVGLGLIAIGFYLVELPATFTFWWLVGTYSLVVVVSPLAGWLRWRELGRAIEVNEQRLSGR